MRSISACRERSISGAINLCAGTRGDPKPPCAGDSGAPLFYKGTVTGILSGFSGAARHCGDVSFIYTRVDSPGARRFLDG